MKVLVDENIPLVTVEEQRSKGFDVTDIRGSAEQGITDEVLWEKAQQEKRLFMTTDKEFSIHRDEAHHGNLIVRLKQPTRIKIHQRVMQAITKYSEQQWSGLMVVMRDVVQSSWTSRHKE
jgi:predicted nuclease of predicted toxin-antitoxin system